MCYLFMEAEYDYVSVLLTKALNSIRVVSNLHSFCFSLPVLWLKVCIIMSVCYVLWYVSE